MEGHFINRQGTKKDIKIWEDKDYLTARIKAKWAQADHLTKREQIFSESPENKENPNLAQAVEKFSYGLDMLSQLVNKIEEED